ncbi:MAG: hypothetical protein ACOC1U_07980 [Spirochaetota bacterium]
MATCFACGAELPAKIYRNTLCESCGKEAKVCLNCTFYDPSAHWQCRETIPEAVREKDRANFCDYFRVHSGASRTGSQGDHGSNGSARDAFSKLFGDE